jgi:nitrite reductase (NADH) large subunit
MIRYLIIGNGAAGMEAALAIRSVDTEGSITIITSSRYPHYNRPKLIHFLASPDVQNTDDLIVYDGPFYESKKIRNILKTKIVKIDASQKTVIDDGGASYPYDKLLIASGSVPVVPPLPGIQYPGVFTLRSISDVQKFRDYIKSAQKILMVGGGLLGLENAWSLKTLGKDVLVAEGAPWLLPRQLDQDGGRHLQRLLEEKGLEFILGDFMDKLEGDGRGVTSVQLKSGRKEKIDAVLISIGVKADLAFLKDSGISAGRGIIIDDQLKTNIPDIWAAGDVAEHSGTMYGLWTVAREQGKIAGLNMAGSQTRYEGSVPSTLLKITGISVLSVGDIQNPGDQVLEKSDSQAYRKLTVGSDGKPRSAMIIQDRGAIAKTQKIMQGKLDPKAFLESASPAP